MTDSPPRALALAPLVAALNDACALGDTNPMVRGIVHDSRAVARDFLFVALRGARVDGHAFVFDALAAGASAVVVDAGYARSVQFPPGASVVVVPDTRIALSRLAATFFAQPSKSLSVVGVTGTNGKTTTIHLIAALTEAAGIPTGLIGTLGTRFQGRSAPLANTTPLALELQAHLAAMRDRGARAVAIEISSHALALGRVADVDVALGVLTNVTRDHLDFHGSLESYAAAKRSLFVGEAGSFDGAREALLNVDDPFGRLWAAELARAGRPVRTYGFAADAGLRATDVLSRPEGSTFVLDGTRFTLPLPGRFNVANALAAIGAARFFGMGDARSAAILRDARAVPGRMEHFSGAGIDVLVDYAHTPDALRAVLEAAREGARGELRLVFGCGGDRDRGKRPEMGRIASELADRVLVTNDNPRGEDPQAIAGEIVAGARVPSALGIELDRGAAIRSAILEASPGDVVVIAGKGHETYQLTGNEVAHFDDREAAQAALDARARARVPA